jgi:hypothetical protein
MFKLQITNNGRIKHNIKMENNTKLFNIDNVSEQVAYINKSIIAPYVSTTYSTLGGVKNISMMITISLDSKEKWRGSILHNSRYAMFHLTNNGRLEMFSGNTAKKMRRSMVSSVEEAIKKINKYLMSPDKYEDGGNVEATQMKYPPASQSGFTLNTLVPASMYSELKAFNEFVRSFVKQEYNMTIVQYVASKLHYPTVDDLFYSQDVDEQGKRKGRFSVEQIDAIAIAIYNYEINNNAIIIADQTGVGKGRTAAGLIRYTILELQKLPIFVTEKKHLLVDIYRDLVDIGFEANVPQFRRTYETIKKDEYTRDEILKLIKKDLNADDDVRIDFDFPDDDEGSWFSFSKLKEYPKRKKKVKGKEVNVFKDDEEFEKYEEIYDVLIDAYEQHLLEEGYVKEIDTPVSQNEIEKLTEEAEKNGRMRVIPFAPSKIDIIADDFKNPEIVNVLYPKMKDEDIKSVMGYKMNNKGEMVYDFENPPIDEINLPSKYKLIALPYSLIREEQTKDKGGKVVVSPKFRFYQKVVANVQSNGESNPAVLILDEAHNAAGRSSTFRVLSSLIDLASMTTFLSATYAKRPDNMPLYAKGTSLKESGLSNEELIYTFEQGKVALQEAVSAELTRNGQILRREKQIQGKTDYFYVYDEDKEYGGKQLGRQQRVRLDNVAQLFDKKEKGNQSEGKTLKTIMDFQKKVSKFVTDYKKDLPTREDNQDRLEGSKDEISKARTIKALTFNLFNYFLIGNKLDQLEYAMLDKMTNGRKLVITIANTLEAALKDMPKYYNTNKQEGKYQIGEEIPNDFNLYLAYLLFYTMRFKLKREVVDMATQSVSVVEEAVCVFDSNHDLARSLRAEFGSQYNQLLNTILSTKTYIPIAPIDVIKAKINGYVDADGYTHTIEEITGRSLMLKFKNKVDENGNELDELDFSKGTIEKRKITPTVKVVKDFNSNVIDHLIINKSGATGISMHPRPVGQAQIVLPTNMVEEINENGSKQEVQVGFPLKLVDKKQVKKRCMIVLQMELDINSEVQKLGRISRTGMVYNPEYVYIVSSIPSESRLTAMMEKKLRSLSANVSSNQEQSKDLFSADDFFSDDAIIPFERTIDDLGWKGVTDGVRVTKEFIKDYTKTLYFKTFEDQRDFYDTFSNNLKKHIEYLKSIGDYFGQMTTKDYKTTTISQYPFYIGNENARTSFGRHARISKVEANVPVKKTNEADINQTIELMYGTENYYGSEYMKFQNLDGYKEYVSKELKRFANTKIEKEQSDIDTKKSSIEYTKGEIKGYEIELKLLIEKGDEVIALLKSLIDKEKELAEVEEPYKKAIAEENFEEAGKLKFKVNAKREEVATIKNNLNQYESITQGDSNINEEKILNKRTSLETKISRYNRFIGEYEQDIKNNESQIAYYNDLLNKSLFMVSNVGGVFDFVSYDEEEKLEDDGDTTSAYEYSINQSDKCVITGVFVSSYNFTAGNIDLRFSTLTETFRVPFSQIVPNFSDSDKKLNRKATNKFSAINDTYIKYWDEEVLKKTAGTKKEIRWIVDGNILRGFKGALDVDLKSVILKYTTLDSKQKIGIEVKNIVDSQAQTSTYASLDSFYENEYAILFDANPSNFSSFIMGYLYDQYVGRFYNMHRNGESYDDGKDVNSYYAFQIATKLGLSFLVVRASYDLVDYSSGLKNALYSGRMEDVSEMSEEEFISKLTVEVVSEKNAITDVFALVLEVLDLDNIYYVRKASKVFDQAIVITKTNFSISYISAKYFDSVIPVNKTQIREKLNPNGDISDNYNIVKDISFEDFLRVIEYLDSMNAKPTLGVSNKYYEKYANLYMLDDNFEQKIIAPDNLPTNAEDEISKMIEELLNLI